MTNERLLIHFSLFDGLYWAWNASFCGFITTYMLQCGMDSTVLSLMLAAFMLLSFLGAFYWGGMCDKLRTNRKVFLVAFAVSAILAFVTWFLSGSVLMLAAVLYPLAGFLISPLGANIDGWMLREFHLDAALYGRARAIGSAGYAVAMLVVGQIVNHFGFIMLPVCFGVLSLLVFILALSAQESPYGEKARTLKPANPSGLLKIGPFLFLLLILFFTGLAISPVNNLKNVLLESVGGNVGTIGIDAFLGVMLQAFFIFISGKLTRMPKHFRLFLVAFMVLLTMVCVIVASSPFFIIIGTLFSNASYGIMLPTMREITEDTVPEELKNTARSLTDAVFGNFAGILALLYGGWMMDSFGAKSVAWLGLVIMVVPVLMAMVKMRKD